MSPRSARIVMILLGSTPSLAAFAGDPCAPPLQGISSTMTDVGSIGIALSGISQSTLDTARNAWNNVCNQGVTNMTGKDVPYLRGTTGGDFDVTVTKINAACPGTCACGRFTPTYSGGRLIGGAVQIYSQTSQGSLCSGADQQRALRHELGHVLGLDHGTFCSDRVMGNSNVAPKASDCAAANTLWLTPFEKGQAQNPGHLCSNPPV